MARKQDAQCRQPEYLAVPSLGYEGAVYFGVPNRGTMLALPDAYWVLQEVPDRVELDPMPYRLPVELRKMAPVVPRTMRAGSTTGSAALMPGSSLTACPGTSSPGRSSTTPLPAG